MVGWQHDIPDDDDFDPEDWDDPEIAAQAEQAAEDGTSTMQPGQ
jgi:hypothetical protein